MQRQIIGPTWLQLLIAVLLSSLAVSHGSQQLKLLPDVSNASIVRSSHSAAAAIVAQYLKLTDSSRSLIATQGDIEGAIYSCKCSKDLHYWHIAPGLVTWAGANFKLISTAEKCRRSNDPKETATFEELCKEIDEKRPVIVTLSFDATSSEGLHRCLDSQQRISVAGVGYTKEPRGILVLLPENIEKEKHASQLSEALVSAPEPAVDKDRFKLLSWNIEVANVVFTFVRP